MLSMNEIKVEPVVCLARMVVFVPQTLENIADFAQQVYYLAIAEQREVLYLAVNSQDGNELTAARQLATLTALTHGNSVQARSLQIQAEDWTEALRQVTHPGDLIIWPERRLLAPASLENDLGIKQYALPGSYASAATNILSKLRPVLFWLSGLALLAGFAFLEVRLNGLVSGTLKKVVLMFLFTLAAAVFYQWNRMFD